MTGGAGWPNGTQGTIVPRLLSCGPGSSGMGAVVVGMGAVVG